MQHPNKEMMNIAIELAKENKKRGGLGISAIIVNDSKIISQGTATINTTNDPTSHAEMNAIKEAAKKIKSYKLEKCWLYSTFEPCPMCSSASIWARLEGIVYGANMQDQNEKHPQRILIKCEDILKKGTPKLKLYKEFMREECKKLID